MRNNWNNNALTYGGFWVRLAAYAIDSVIVFFALLFVRLFTSGLLSLTEGTALGGNILFSYTLKDIILYVFQVLYFILFTYCAGTTPGKWLLNLRVVSAGEERLSFTDVLYRETVGRFLCGLTIGIGYILAGVDKDKRGLHDMLCDTRVIYAKRIKAYPRYQVPPAGNVPPVPPAGNVPGQVPPVGNVPGQVPPAGSMPGQMPPVGSVPGQVPPVGNVPRQVPPAGSMPGQVPPGGSAPYHMVRPEDEIKERDSQQ